MAMHRFQYFGLGLISLILGTLSFLIFYVGHKIYGSDAGILFVMGYFFFTSLRGFSESIIGLRKIKRKGNGGKNNGM